VRFRRRSADLFLASVPARDRTFSGLYVFQVGNITSFAPICTSFAAKLLGVSPAGLVLSLGGTITGFVPLFGDL